MQESGLQDFDNEGRLQSLLRVGLVFTHMLSHVILMATVDGRGIRVDLNGSVASY